MGDSYKHEEVVIFIVCDVVSTLPIPSRLGDGNMLKTLVVERPMVYDASQLQPHWIYRNYDLLGDAAIAFRGEANVNLEDMVDLSDVKHSEPIYSPDMLHFMIEHFHTNLELAIYQQRMFMVAIKDELEQYEIPVVRMGSNLYLKRGKLSVSVATVSNISSLFHIGLNIDTKGTPLKTVGLNELNIKDYSSFAASVMLRYQRDLESIEEARCKVKGIRPE